MRGDTTHRRNLNRLLHRNRRIDGGAIQETNKIVVVSAQVAQHLLVRLLVLELMKLLALMKTGIDVLLNIRIVIYPTGIVQGTIGRRAGRTNRKMIAVVIARATVIRPRFRPPQKMNMPTEINVRRNS